MKATEDKNLGGHLAIFSAQIIFGVNMIIGKKALAWDAVSPDALTLYRMVGTMLLMWFASLFFPRERVARRDLLLLLLASLFGMTINQTIFIRGLSLTSPVNASMIATISPIITMALAALYLREPITWKKATGVFLAVIGALILILGGDRADNLDGNLRGDLLCLLSCTSFAVYLTFFRDVVRRYSFITVMKWMFTFAALCTLPFGHRYLSLEVWNAMNTEALLEVGYVVVLSTFVAYLLVSIGQQTLRPTVVSIYSNIQPLVASIATVALGMGAFGWRKAGAAALIFAGVYITTISRSRAQMEQARKTSAPTPPSEA
ncbi:membrane protein [Bacteroidia bacterium]|nr:membrane protein [Bacteroidia bacterium]